MGPSDVLTFDFWDDKEVIYIARWFLCQKYKNDLSNIRKTTEAIMASLLGTS